MWLGWHPGHLDSRRSLALLFLVSPSNVIRNPELAGPATTLGNQWKQRYSTMELSAAVLSKQLGTYIPGWAQQVLVAGGTYPSGQQPQQTSTSQPDACRWLSVSLSRACTCSDMITRNRSLPETPLNTAQVQHTVAVVLPFLRLSTSHSMHDPHGFSVR